MRALTSRSRISRSHGVLLPPPGGAAPVRGPVGRADHDAVFHPLLDVLSAVAERGGRLDAAEAAGFARALERANASLERRLKERASATSAASPASPASPIGPGSRALIRSRSRSPIRSRSSSPSSSRRSTGWSRS
ncbi:hypothetical protein SAMN05442782_6046 [Streptomyces sp. OK228]|nr:hypothetical protein SAMN05442782_6046 [Streptomyces sp. OK228]